MSAIDLQPLVCNSSLTVGVDIGGTNTKLAVVDSDGGIVLREVVPTASMQDPRDACLEIARFVTDSAKVRGLPAGSVHNVGVAVPGVLAPSSQVLKEVANLPKWTGFAIRDELQKLFGNHIAVSNDANAAAFAEFTHRHLTQETLALVTLGTGTGCGVVLNGRPFVGDGGCGGEIGHAVINCSPVARKCGCGKWGHLEAYTGAAGVVQTMRHKLEHAPGNPLVSKLKDRPLTPELIAEEAEQGNAACQSAIDDTARFLGIGISVLCQTLNPSIVLLGGAMTFGGNQTATGRRFLSRVTESVHQNSLEQIAAGVKIAFATLGSDAGMLGAAELARTTGLQPVVSSA